MYFPKMAVTKIALLHSGLTRGSPIRFAVATFPYGGSANRWALLQQLSAAAASASRRWRPKRSLQCDALENIKKPQFPKTAPR